MLVLSKKERRWEMQRFPKCQLQGWPRPWKGTPWKGRLSHKVLSDVSPCELLADSRKEGAETGSMGCPHTLFQAWLEEARLVS